MKKYKIYVSRKEKILFIVTIALFTVFIIGFYVVEERNALVLLFQLPWVMVFLTQPREVKLHDDDTLELRSYMKNKAFKPISIQQIVSYKLEAKNKNKLTIVYFRNQLRGSWSIRLSETDVADLVAELTRRNPAIVKQ